MPGSSNRAAAARGRTTGSCPMRCVSCGIRLVDEALTCRYERDAGEGNGNAGELRAGDPFRQDEPCERDEDDWVQRSQHRYDADEPVSCGPAIEQIGAGVEEARRDEDRKRGPQP